MQQSNNDKSHISNQTIKNRRDAHLGGFVCHIIIFVVNFSITSIFTYFYYYYFRRLSINEIVSLNNGISFPFINLTIKFINNNFKIKTILFYKSKKNSNLKPIIIENKMIKDIKSELKIPNLTLEDENEYLIIGFSFNEKNITKEQEKFSFIELENGIYTFNMSQKDFKVRKESRRKIFIIEEELYFSSKKKEPRFYQFFIRSHSIKTLNETYEFPVIDDHYNIIPTPIDFINEKDLKFAIFLRKKKLLNSLEIIGDSQYKIFWDSFGTVAAIFEFLIPIILYFWENIKLLIIKLSTKLCPKEQNSQSEQIKQSLQSQNLIANESSPQNNNETEMKIMSEKNIYSSNN